MLRILSKKDTSTEKDTSTKKDTFTVEVQPNFEVVKLFDPSSAEMEKVWFRVKVEMLPNQNISPEIISVNLLLGIS